MSSTDAATGLRWSDTIDDIDWAELSALYRRFGFRRLLTAMAIFPDAEAAVRRGYLGD